MAGASAKIRIDTSGGFALPVDIQGQPVQVYGTTAAPVYASVYGYSGVTSTEQVGLDETEAQFLEVTQSGKNYWLVAVKATAATNVRVYVKSPSGTYYLLDSASSVTDYAKLFIGPLLTVKEIGRAHV